LDNAGNDFGSSVNLSNTGANAISVRDVGSLVLGNVSMSSGAAGGLTVQAGGDITQLAGTTITTGTGAVQITGINNSSVNLANAGNAFNGTVTLAPSAGAGNRLLNVTLLDTTAFQIQNGLTLAGNLSLTAAGITQAGPITVVGSTTVSAGANAIILDNAGNDFGSSVNLSNTGANAISVRDVGSLVLGNISMTSGAAGALTVQAGGDITQLAGTTITTGTGAVQFTGINNSSVTLANAGNAFNGAVTLAPSVGVGNRLLNVTLLDTTAFQIQNGLTLAGNLSLTAAGITQAGPITVVGTTTLNGGTGAIVLANSGNSYLGTVSITGGASADMFFALADEGEVGPVSVTGVFTLLTANGVAINLAGPGGTGDFDVSDTTLAGFNVGTFAPVASGVVGNGITINSPFNFPGIQNLTLTTQGAGNNISTSAAVFTGTLSLSSAGTATFNAVNSISSLGSVSIGSGGLTLQNNRGLSLGGTATMPGRLSLEVAGQFYNFTGSAYPLAGVGQGSVIKSLSLAGGLPGLMSTMAGFGVRYDGRMPTSGNVMSYAVSPLTMFAPSGTIIAGVDLSGTQTGGGQLNTFFTGSDNLNWMIADFGKFNLPRVEPARMEYMLYQQRVEPETRSLPQPVMRELTMELGRPPTIEELQAREVAKRQAVQMRSGAILERSSFDEEVEEPKQEAMGPVPILDGGKPQAGGPSVAPNPLRGGAMEGFGPQAGVNSESEKRNAETGPTGSDPKTVQGNQLATDPARGLTPSAKKQTDNKRDANGPMLRSGPRRAVALRAEPVDAAQIIQAERERAEVNVAPPVAATPR
jgi:hypothetical protein